MTKPTKTKTGKWTIRLYDYQDETGKQHYKRITADTKDQCALLAAQYQADKARKKASPQRLTVGEAVDVGMLVLEVHFEARPSPPVGRHPDPEKGQKRIGFIKFVEVTFYVGADFRFH